MEIADIYSTSSYIYRISNNEIRSFASIEKILSEKFNLLKTSPKPHNLTETNNKNTDFYRPSSANCNVTLKLYTLNSPIQTYENNSTIDQINATKNFYRIIFSDCSYVCWIIHPDEKSTALEKDKEDEIFARLSRGFDLKSVLSQSFHGTSYFSTDMTFNVFQVESSFNRYEFFLEVMFLPSSQIGIATFNEFRAIFSKKLNLEPLSYYLPVAQTLHTRCQHFIEFRNYTTKATTQ
eukprot:TRINITY_DN695_c0_g1_i1.p1 TRINITY_DN695_c0_g1~~TRINITY_DN695_c0_g1_i1.p1  ORF type:complete len:246 (-),score=39.33 TRINITY_DN695_c0_g1_i1:48-755(-)